MSSRRLAARRISVLLEPRTRSSLQHGYHVGNVKPRPSIQWRIKALEYIKPLATYATSTGQRLDVQRLRTDVDKRARIGFYTLSHQQGALSIKPDKADAIIAEFLAQTKNMDHASNVKQLVAKHKLQSVEDMASLAIITYKIPDLADASKRAMLPPSQHKTISGSLLQGCAQAEDPLAIIHILTAVYLSSMNADTSVKELAALFPQNEIAKYRKTLDRLSSKSRTIALGPEALTLQGLFLERDGKKEQAKASYVEAVERCHFKYNPRSRHPMQLPLITPWNALGTLLKSDKDPNIQAQAKAYFEKGAREGDDPLSCYELAGFEDRASTQWLQYTSKAAASGHRQAIADLASFYQDVSTSGSSLLGNSNLRKALNWLLGWRPGSAAKLANEWLQTASKYGHKPSTLLLADHYKSLGDEHQAKEYLRRLMEPPTSKNPAEEWPQLVQVAKKRLAGIKT